MIYFCTAIPMRDKIYAKFNAECVEMEGAAIGQVCSLCNVPFVVIKVYPIHQMVKMK